MNGDQSVPGVHLMFWTPGTDIDPRIVGTVRADEIGFTATYVVTGDNPAWCVDLPSFVTFVQAAAQRYVCGDRAGWRDVDGGAVLDVVVDSMIDASVPDLIPESWLSSKTTRS